MKINTSIIKIMRRLLIGLILLVFLAVLFNYMQARQRRNDSAKEAPKILSSDMVRSMEDFEYSDYREGVLQFKIHAQKLLESDDKKSYLEGIEACDFAPDGSIRNEIRSQFAQFDQKRNLVDFSGDVRLFLRDKIVLRTDSLHYDLNANVGTTKDALQFYADEASGTARGVRFNQKRGLLDLASEVDFILTEVNAFSGNGGEPEKLHITSQKASFSERANRILFEGKARIHSNSGTLTGESIKIILDSDQKRVTLVDTVGDAAYRFKEAGETRSLSGDRIVFGINESGALERIRISTQAAFSSTSPSGELGLQGDEIILAFDPEEGSLNRLRGLSNVSFRFKNGQKRILISGNELYMVFNPETDNVRSLSVHEQAALSISDSEESPGNELQADEIRISFLEKDGRAVMKRLRAEGSAEWRSALQGNDGASRGAGGPSPGEGWTLTAKLVELHYSGEGDFLESVSASGDAVISRNADEPSASVRVRRLHADYAQFRFFPETNQPKDMDATGNVRVIYERKRDPAVSSDIENFRTASEKMSAVFEPKNGAPVLKSVVQSGNFTYQDALRTASAGIGNYNAARELLVLEQLPKISDEMSVTTGKRMEYDMKQRELSVFGRVRSVLGSGKDKGSFFGFSESSSPIIVTSEEMGYKAEDGYARYAKKVQLLSESQHLQAQILEIFGSGDQIEAQGDILHIITRSKEFRNPPDKSGESASAKKEPITIRSVKFKYSRESGELAYSGNVRLNSGDVELFSGSFNAVMDDERKDIESGEARKKVFLRHGERKCRGDVAYWYLDPGKFVVTGDPAETDDPDRGRSFFQQLTYFTADGRILLESR